MKKKTTQPQIRSKYILDYPDSMSQYEKESQAAEAILAEQRQIDKLEKLLKRSK
jgi:hypothetical protein